MAAPEDLAALAADLRRLPGSRRRAVLAALTPFERARVRALLSEAKRAPRSSENSDLAAFSPWLAARIAAARRPEPASRGAATPTPGVRALLLSLAEQVSREAAAPSPPPSLIGALAGLLGRRRAPL